MNYSRIIAGTMTWGSWGKGLSASEMTHRIHACLEMGITTFDHADIYGGYTTEAQFGEALAASHIYREDIQLISKCGIQYLTPSRKNRIKHYDLSPSYIKWSVETSLQALKTDYLDLLLLHRPSPLMNPKEIAEVISDLQKEGKIKDFGLSNFTPSQTELIKKHTRVSVNQIQCSLSHYHPLLNGELDYMQTNDIIPMAWSPLGKALTEASEQSLRIRKVLSSLKSTYQAAEDQLLLAWLLQHPAGIHPVIGTTQPDRMKQAIEALSIRLDREDWFELLVASQGHKVP